jgi:hypothetical protein
MAQQANALQIVSLDSPEMVSLSGPETRKYLETRLAGAKFTATDPTAPDCNVVVPVMVCEAVNRA